MTLTRRQRTNKLIKGGCVGRFCVADETELERQQARQQGFNIRRQQREAKSLAHKLLLEQKDIANKKLEALRKQFKNCWINPDGKRVCKNNSIFVSPEQFAKNLDNFIMNDLPKGLTILTVLPLLGPGVIPIVVIAPLVGLSRGISFQKSGFGASNNRRKRKRNV